MSTRSPSLMIVTMAALALGADCGQPLPPPLEGKFNFIRPFEVDAFGMFVNAAGGNGRLERTDWTIETRLGTYRLGASYNGTSGTWRFNYEMTFDGAAFVDASGALHDVSQLQPGDAIPGTQWVYLDATSIKTKGGRLHEFGAGGRLTRTRWISGPYPSIEYVESVVAGAPRISGANECWQAATCPVLFSATFDPQSGAVESITDRAGRTSAYSYDASGRLGSAKDTLDTARGWTGFVYEYAGASSPSIPSIPSTRLSAFTSSEGERVEVEYDADGRIAELRRVGASASHSYRFAYVVFGGFLTTLTDPEGHLWSYSWDEQYRPESMTTPSGDTSSWTWSGRRLASHTRPDGSSTVLGYGAGEDPQTITQPSGNVVQLSYHSAGEDRGFPSRTPFATVTDSLGLVEQRSYDAQDRLDTLANGAGEVMQYVYFANGQTENLIDSATLPSGRTANFVYAGGNVHGGPDLIYAPSEVEAIEYDAVGNVLRSKSTAGPLSGGAAGIVSRTFDEDRNIASVTVEDLPLGPLNWQTLDLEWRSDGRQSAFRRPYGGDTEFDYDAFGNLIEMRERVDGQWVRTEWDHDRLGRVLMEELANGMQRGTAYRPDGRPHARLFAQSGANETLALHAYVAGRPVSYWDGSYGGLPPQQWSYDAAGRPETMDFPHGESIEIEYDARSRPIRETYRYASGIVLRTLEYDYDLANRLVEVRADGVMLVRNTFVGGEHTEEEFRSGLRHELTYDEGTGAPYASLFRDPAGSLVAIASITRDFCNGSFPTVHCAVHATTSPLGGTDENYALASSMEVFEPTAGQHLRTSTPAGSFQDPTSSDMQWYEYDLLGNRTRQSQFGSGQVDDFVYNAEHSRLERVVDAATGGDLATYGYDAAGYLTDRAGEPITWDAKGQLTSVGARIQLSWDTRYRPISRTIDGVTTRQRFGGLATASSSGVVQTLHVGSISIDVATGAERYRHSDFRGNVKFVSDESGTIITDYTYTGYGLFSVDGDDSDRVRFAHGTQLDDDLVLIGVRVYDQKTGRFLSPDPRYQLINQYAYTTGNPIAQSDVLGLHPSTAGKVGAVAVAAGTIVIAAASAPAVATTGAFIAFVGASLVAWDAVFGGDDSPISTEATPGPGTPPQCTCGIPPTGGPMDPRPRLPRGPGTDTGNAGEMLIVSVLNCGGAPTAIAQLPGLLGVVQGLMPVEAVLSFWLWQRWRRARRRR